MRVLLCTRSAATAAAACSTTALIAAGPMLPQRSNAGSSATSAPGPGAPRPHLRRDRAASCHICTGTALLPATSAPGPSGLTPPDPHQSCTHSGRPAATSAPGPGLRPLRLLRLWTHPAATATPITATRPTGTFLRRREGPRLPLLRELGSPQPHLHRDRAPPPRRLQDCALLRFPATSAPDRPGAAASAKWEWPKWDRAV